MMLGKTLPRRTKVYNKTPETPKASPRLLQDSSKKPPPVAPHEAAVRMCGVGGYPPRRSAGACALEDAALEKTVWPKRVPLFQRHRSAIRKSFFPSTRHRGATPSNYVQITFKSP